MSVYVQCPAALEPMQLLLRVRAVLAAWPGVGSGGEEVEGGEEQPGVISILL